MILPNALRDAALAAEKPAPARCAEMHTSALAIMAAQFANGPLRRDPTLGLELELELAARARGWL